MKRIRLCTDEGVIYKNTYRPGISITFVVAVLVFGVSFLSRLLSQYMIYILQGMILVSLSMVLLIGFWLAFDSKDEFHVILTNKRIIKDGFSLWLDTLTGFKTYEEPVESYHGKCKDSYVIELYELNRMRFKITVFRERRFDVITNALSIHFNQMEEQVKGASNQEAIY